MNNERVDNLQVVVSNHSSELYSLHDSDRKKIIDALKQLEGIKRTLLEVLRVTGKGKAVT